MKIKKDKTTRKGGSMRGRKEKRYRAKRKITREEKRKLDRETTLGQILKKLRSKIMEQSG